MPIFNVEIRATNKYKAGLAVTEYPLSIGGGWSDKMPAFLTPGGGVGTALCWGYEIKGQMGFRYYDAAVPFELIFYIGEKGRATAEITPKSVVIPGPIKHYVHWEMTYNVARSTLNITLAFMDPTK